MAGTERPGSTTVRSVSDSSGVVPRNASSSSVSSAASSTRPIDVAWAGSRVPTPSVMDMIRRVGTRAT